MATTRLIPLHIGKGRTVGTAIEQILDYVENPSKTGGGKLITSWECDSRVADREFLLSKQQYIRNTGRVRGEDDVIAYHLRQSFRPGEITPEEANRLGCELARRFTKSSHAYIVCTHIDKAHIHNHVIWNSTALDEHSKFRNFWGSTKALRRLNDTICVENGYSIVENPKGKSKTYDKWLGDQKKPSHRERICYAIDEAIAQKPSSFEELLELLRRSGYQVKGGKVPSLLGEGQKRFIRMDTLGADYTPDDLRAIIAGTKAHTPKKKRVMDVPAKPSGSLLIDIQAKLQEGKGAGYARWAKNFNLKQLSQTLIYLEENNLLDRSVLEERTAAATAQYHTLSAKMKSAEQRMADITQEARDLLIEIYDALSAGSMQLPVEGEFRYLELADVSFAENACIQNVEHEDEDHKNKYEILHETNAVLTVEFELEIVPEGDLLVLAYIDEEWEIVENVTDLGDGKVVCTFEDICPVVFIDHKGDSGSEPPTEVITTEPGEYPIDSANFVPSITYKDGLEIKEAETNIETIDGKSWGDGIDECVVVTSIAQAIEKSTDISQEDRDLLLEVYEAIAKGEMELPLKSDYVIRDLVDISFEYDDCRCIEEHGHKDECLAEDGVTLTLTYDMDVPASAHVTVMAYVDGEWSAIKSVVNNGDGTVTCIFEDICPVAFVVNETGNADGPLTGDAMGQNMWIWMAVMAACVAGITILLLMKRKKVV